MSVNSLRRVDLNTAPSHARYLRKKWFDELLIAQYGSVKKVIARPRSSRKLRTEESLGDALGIASYPRNCAKHSEE